MALADDTFLHGTAKLITNAPLKFGELQTFVRTDQELTNVIRESNEK